MARPRGFEPLLTAGTVLTATALLTVLLAYLSGVIGGVVQDFTAAAGHGGFSPDGTFHPLEPWDGERS